MYDPKPPPSTELSLKFLAWDIKKIAGELEKLNDHMKQLIYTIEKWGEKL